MAGGKLRSGKRLHASTILEVVVALVMIALVFGLAMTIFANVMRSSLSSREQRAQAILSGLLLDMAQQKNLENASFSVDSLRILQEVKPYEKAPDLLEVHLIASSNGKNIAEARMVIHAQK